MATTSDYLGLVLPAFGEYYNSWYTPVNGNFKKIDAFANAFGSEIQAARGSVVDLNTRLSVGLNLDGSFKDIPAIVAAESSSVYGFGSGNVLQSLDARLELGDVETFQARQGLSALIDSVAFANSGNSSDCLVSGPLNPLTNSGAVVTLNGATTPVISNINGYRAKTEINDSVTISGGAGTYYLTLTRNPAGKAYASLASGDGIVGVTATSTPLYTKFSSATTNLLALGVKPGHILSITGPSGNANVGRWVVYQTYAEDPVNLTTNDITIIGDFPAGGAGLNATFLYPQAPTLGFTSTAPSPNFAPANGVITIGKLVFDGTNIVSLSTFAYQAKFASWQQITPVAGNFNLAISHNLGFIPKRIHLYGSQNNDFSQPLEPLSIAQMSAGSASLTAGDQTITYTSPVLQRSVIVKFDNYTINIKNATNGIFYEDFTGNLQVAGYLYIVVER